MMDLLVDILTAIAVITGGLFSLVAGIGVLKMQDVLIRMHASTKAGTLGCGLILLAVALHFGEIGVIARATAAIIFLMITAPVAAHMIGRAAYRTGVPLDIAVVDEAAQSSIDPRRVHMPSGNREKTE